jgi:hypothetical protein
VRGDRLDLEACARLERLPDTKRPSFPFRLDRVERTVRHHALRGAKRGLADEHAVHRRRRLHARRRVHDVAGGHSFARLGASVEIDQRFAAVHGDPHLDLSVFARPVPDRERCPYRTLRVVLVRSRRTEERHHGVSDELLDGPAGTLQLRAQTLVVGRRIASTSSGSSASDRAVKPTRSANSTVTILRSRRGPLSMRRVYGG